MKIIAIMAQKGGTGKTTTATTLAYDLAQLDGPVLLIDADSQCNTTAFFGGDPAKGSVAKVLREAIKHHDSGAWAALEIQSTAFWGIDLLAADDSLMDLDLSKAESGSVDATTVRKRAVRSVTLCMRESTFSMFFSELWASPEKRAENTPGAPPRALISSPESSAKQS